MERSSTTPDEEFLEELRRHRAELRESMSALEDALATPPARDRQRWAQRVQVAAMELAGDFREHVDITEAPDGLYSEVLKTSPRLSGAVATLTREHVLIRGQVDSLLARVAAPAVIGDVDRVRDLGTALLGRLVRHRQRGSDLVFEAYEYDIGGED
jgi:aminopeptidase N